MVNGSLKELYFHELGELYDCENQKILMLARLAEAARDPELRAALTRHCAEARLHIERLQLIFLHWGETRRARRSATLAGFVQEADNRLNDPETATARDAAIIGVAHRLAYYEIAAYGAAHLYARWLNRMDDARLIEESLEEEGRADQRLTDIAEAHISAESSGASAA